MRREQHRPGASDELVDLLNEHPQASKQLSQHWLAAAGFNPFVVVVAVVQLAFIESLNPRLVPLPCRWWQCSLPLITLPHRPGHAHGQRPHPAHRHWSDAARITTLVVWRRRNWVLILAWLGQLTALFGAFYGYTFSNHPG